MSTQCFEKFTSPNKIFTSVESNSTGIQAADKFCYQNLECIFLFLRHFLKLFCNQNQNEEATYSDGHFDF